MAATRTDSSKGWWARPKCFRGHTLVTLFCLVILLVAVSLATAGAQEVEVTRVNAEAEVTITKEKKHKDPFIGGEDDFDRPEEEEEEPRFRRDEFGRFYYP